MDLTVRRVRVGFTLVELLVVIVIIGILVSLVVVAAPLALDAAHRTRIKVELDNIAMAFEQYENKNTSYPPNLVSQDPSPPLDFYNGLARHIKKTFPRSVDGNHVVAAFAGLDPPLSPSEAVVFWLGGFSANPQLPFVGKDGPTATIDARPNSLFEFDQSRIGPRGPAGDMKPREVSVRVPNEGDFVILLYEYYPPDLIQPYVYFDTSRGDPAVDWPSHPNATNSLIKPYIQKNPSSGMHQFVNAASFQILSAGTDDEWGIPFNAPIVFPDGPFTGGHADNLTNFTTGTLEDAQP